MKDFDFRRELRILLLKFFSCRFVGSAIYNHIKALVGGWPTPEPEQGFILLWTII